MIIKNRIAFHFQPFRHSLYYRGCWHRVSRCLFPRYRHCSLGPEFGPHPSEDRE
ncbi:hypothetical protein Hanom_Chr01g00008971 [Helianthus anomalus]